MPSPAMLDLIHRFQTIDVSFTVACANGTFNGLVEIMTVRRACSCEMTDDNLFGLIVAMWSAHTMTDSKTRGLIQAVTNREQAAFTRRYNRGFSNLTSSQLLNGNVVRCACALYQWMTDRIFIDVEVGFTGDTGDVEDLEDKVSEVAEVSEVSDSNNSFIPVGSNVRLDSLQCGICLESPTLPYILHCRHVMCSVCWAQCYKASRGTIRDGMCPSCAKPVSSSDKEEAMAFSVSADLASSASVNAACEHRNVTRTYDEEDEADYSDPVSFFDVDDDGYAERIRNGGSQYNNGYVWRGDVYGDYGDYSDYSGGDSPPRRPPPPVPRSAPSVNRRYDTYSRAIRLMNLNREARDHQFAVELEREAHDHQFAVELNNSTPDGRPSGMSWEEWNMPGIDGFSPRERCMLMG